MKSQDLSIPINSLLCKLAQIVTGNTQRGDIAYNSAVLAKIAQVPDTDPYAMIAKAFRTVPTRRQKPPTLPKDLGQRAKLYWVQYVNHIEALDGVQPWPTWNDVLSMEDILALDQAVSQYLRGTVEAALENACGMNYRRWEGRLLWLGHMLVDSMAQYRMLVSIPDSELRDGLARLVMYWLLTNEDGVAEALHGVLIRLFAPDVPMTIHGTEVHTLGDCKAVVRGAADWLWEVHVIERVRKGPMALVTKDIYRAVKGVNSTRLARDSIGGSTRNEIFCKLVDRFIAEPPYSASADFDIRPDTLVPTCVSYKKETYPGADSIELMIALYNDILEPIFERAGG